VSWKRVRQDAIECISVIVTDLSEQRRNEEIVSAAKLARSILEQAADAMLVTDLNGRIILASRASDRLAGVSVLLRNFDEVFQVRQSPDTNGYAFRGSHPRRLDSPVASSFRPACKSHRGAAGLHHFTD
jgi:PAS domain-containing protein